MVIIGSHNVFSLIPPWTFQTQARWARRLSKDTFPIRWVMDGSLSGHLLLQKWPCLPYVLGIGTHQQTHSAWQRKPWWPPRLRWSTAVKEQRRQGWVTQTLGTQVKWEPEYLELEKAARGSSLLLGSIINFYHEFWLLSPHPPLISLLLLLKTLFTTSPPLLLMLSFCVCNPLGLIIIIFALIWIGSYLLEQEQFISSSTREENNTYSPSHG